MAEIVVKLVNGELAGKTMQSITKEVNAAAQALKKAEIGTKEWVDANAKLEKTKQLQADLKKQIEGTASASQILKGAWNQLPGAGFFNQIGQSLGMVKTGVGGLVSSMGVLKTAIVATGIGALVVLLGSLYAWFTKTERGGDLLAKASSAIGAAWSVLIDRGSKLIDALIAFASGNWSEAATKFGEATSGVVDEIIRETEAAMELADALDALEEQEGKLILIRSRVKEQVAELRLMAKDEELSLEKRAAAIQRSIELTRDLNKAELDAAKGRIMQALQVTELSEARLQELIDKGEELLTVDNLGLGESTQEDLNKAFEAIAKYNELRAGSFDEERALVMELNKLKKKERSEDDKSLKEQQAALKEHQAAADNLRKLESEKRMALIDDEKTKEIEKINIATEEKIIALQGSEAQILEQTVLLREIQAAEIAAVDEKWRQKKIADDAKWYDDQLKNLEEKAAEEKRIAEEKAEFEANIEAENRALIEEGFQFGADLLADQVKNEKEAKRIKKIGTIVDIGLNLQKELSANSAHAASLGPIAGPPYLIGANIRSIIRSGISAAKVLAFRKGGYTGDGSPDEPAGIVHRKEYVVPEFITQNPAYSGIINTLESARLRGYQAGGPVDPFQSTPSGAATSRLSPLSGGTEYNRLEQFLIDNFIAVNNRIDRIEVINLVSKTQEGIDVINRIERAANV